MIVCLLVVSWCSVVCLSVCVCFSVVFLVCVIVLLHGASSFLVFAEDFHLFGERSDGIDALSVACVVVVHDVDVEHVFPFASDDGERLYLCKVYLVEREDGEHL